MLSWLAPILVFGVVIFVHELGHFLAAKWVGVYTPRFAVGFGKALWKRRRGETEYIIGLLPLGGYVRMASREDEATAFLEGGSENSAVERSAKDDYDPEAMIPFGPKPIPPERWFESKSLPARLFIMLAGVTMNILLALVVMTGLFAGYGRPYLSTAVDSVMTGRPAVAAGITAGDSIVAVNGTRIADWEALVGTIGSSAGRELTLTLSRAGTTREVRVTPTAEEAADPETGAKRQVGRVGIVPKQGRVSVPLGQAIQEGSRATLAMSTAVLKALKSIASRETGVSQLGGPIAIAQSSVQAAQGGVENLLVLLALISVNLAVFNLLPIPILDGGQIVINILESIKGSAFSARTREYILRAGLGAIALLFAVVMFNDLKRLVESIIQRLG